MKIAVITPYYREPLGLLTSCMTSVSQQTYKNVHHVMVADGYANEHIKSSSRLTHIEIPNSGDFGDTPRGVGAAVASALNYDAIAFLDADCWFEPNHLETMVGVMREANVDLVTCPRNLYREDGRFLAVDRESDGYDFNDTNCYLFGKAAIHLARNWMFKSKADSAIGDRHMWANVKAHNVKMARSLKPTLNYITRVVQHYKELGEMPPKDSQTIMITDKTIEIYKLARMIYK
jgi:glycosyltransferase involved in cell wall biosynthesis